MNPGVLVLAKNRAYGKRRRVRPHRHGRYRLWAESGSWHLGIHSHSGSGDSPAWCRSGAPRRTCSGSGRRVLRESSGKEMF